MKNDTDTILYIGKAKELKKRVSSYLNPKNTLKVSMLMRQVVDIDHIVTSSEYEALLLENSLIKKHKPHYNILLKDDKTFPMIKITQEEYPRVLKTRKVLDDKAQYYGPYLDTGLLYHTLSLIDTLYPLRKCTKMRPRTQPCLYYHINRCAAVCANKTSKEEYLKRIKSIKTLLQGKTKEIRSYLTTKMHEHSQKLEFERAKRYRDALSSIEQMEEKQVVVDHKQKARDYVALAEEGNTGCVVLVHIREGKVVDHLFSHLTVFDSPKDSLEQFLISHYTSQTLLPDKLYLPWPCSDSFKEFIARTTRTAHIQICIPDNRSEFSIMRFALENAFQRMRYRIKQEGKPEQVIALGKILGKALNLKSTPARIEGYDIATIDGKHTVAAQVCFVNGIPEKKYYRRYKIRSLTNKKADDFAALQESIARRFTRLINTTAQKKHQKNNQKKSSTNYTTTATGTTPHSIDVFPDLILIDGGKGQVNSVHEIITALGLHIPILGLAKKKEEIFLPHTHAPIVLPLHHPASRLLQAVRNEAHRFATSYRAGLQSKELSLSLYKSVKGIGERRAQLLARLFEGPQDLVDAPPDIIAKGIGIDEQHAVELIATVRASIATP